MAWVSLRELYHMVGLGQTQLKLDNPMGDQLIYQVINPPTEIFFYIKYLLPLK